MGTAAVAALVGAVCGAGVGVGTYAALENGTDTSTSSGFSVSGQQSPVNAPPKGVTGVAARLKPSVVTIDAVGAQQGGAGSGIILRPDGYILTNDHVVSLDGSQSLSSVHLTVVFDDGSQAPARVVGA
ncbi:MAG TPA: trypsin-like peptidase domain-containing protein, partial [Gaiellales bacterium]|nr:trypsin-like peptidase domain-containing protein [Gaiellales bacterium]